MKIDKEAWDLKYANRRRSKMEREDRMWQIHRYVENSKKIRMLSTPDINLIKNADDYCRILTDNFSKIGELAAENRELIDSVTPIFASVDALPDAIREAAMQLVDLLVQEDSFEEVDFHMAERLDDFLIQNEIAQTGDNDNDSDRVISMAKRVKRDYFFISALTRYINDETDQIREAAIENAKELGKYLAKDAFVRLNDEAKGFVLQYSLMSVLLYENNLYSMPLDWWEEALAILDRAESVLQDSFYRETFPDYDWDTYEFRIYYYGGFLAYSLIPESIAKRVLCLAEKGVVFLENCSNETILSAVNIEQMKGLQNMAAVIAKVRPAREACDNLYKEYENRDKTDYSVTGINNNLDTPSLYLNLVKLTGLELTEADHDRYHEIEHSVLQYIHKLPKRSNAYLKCVTLVTNYPMYYREVPGGMTMEEFCLSAFAAIHPPTYVHSNMVARLAHCMVRHLLKSDPELFIGFPDCQNVQEVMAAKERILHYTYHAALCHDMGKLFIIDTISMYGRRLLDDEFMMIKSHPVSGAKIAAEHRSTRDYTDVIRGHHLWYDCSGGYPSHFDTFKSPYKTIIDLVTAADCLDAATDTVGRSYSRGKSFLEYEKEIAEGAGTRYAPFLPDLFKQPLLRQDIEHLLDRGRKKQYREAFYLLKNQT